MTRAQPLLFQRRFEEILEEPPKTAKRPRESDADGASKTEKKAKKAKAEDGTAVPAEGDKKEKKKTDKKEREIAGGIKIKDSEIGTGPQAKKGNTVSMRYIGKLQNGKVFDKNVKGKPVRCSLSFCELDSNSVIVCLQTGQRRSDQRRVVIYFFRFNF